MNFCNPRMNNKYNQNPFSFLEFNDDQLNSNSHFVRVL